MKTRLPSVKNREVIAALQRAGFVVKNVRGGHKVLSNGRVSVSVSHGAGDVPFSTLRRILRSANMTAEEFEQLRKG